MRILIIKVKKSLPSSFYFSEENTTEECIYNKYKFH